LTCTFGASQGPFQPAGDIGDQEPLPPFSDVAAGEDFVSAR
jgi:hypothetical protein